MNSKVGGARLFNKSGFTAGEQVTWHMSQPEAFPIANGVYLYIVTVRGHDGQIIQTKVRKLVILR